MMIITMDVEQLERFYSKLDQKGKSGGGGGSAPPAAPDPVATA